MLCKSRILPRIILVFTTLLVCLCTFTFSFLFLPPNQVSAADSNEMELDPYLRQAVLSKLGKSFESTDPVTVGDIKNLTGTLLIRDVALKSIKGLEYAALLGTLIINNTELEDISVISNLHNLSFLFLNKNKISKLPSFSKLNKLEIFEIKQNNITDISPVLDAVNLVNLQMDDNKISTLPDMKRLSKLTTLYLMNNKISDLTPLSNMPSLEKLYLTGNMVSDYSVLANNVNLKELFLTENKIHNFPNTIFKSLTSLNLSMNNLDDCNFKNQFPDLITLDLLGCNISDFTVFMSHPTLENLSVSNNQISDITPLISSGNKKLIFINLQNNNIASLLPLEKYDFHAEILLQGNNFDMNDPQNAAILNTLFQKHPYSKFIEYDFFDSLTLESGKDSIDLLKGNNHFTLITHDKTAKINLHAAFSELPFTYKLEWINDGTPINIPIVDKKIAYQMDPSSLQKGEPVILRLKYNIYGENVIQFNEIKYYTVHLNDPKNSDVSSNNTGNISSHSNTASTGVFSQVFYITVVIILIAVLILIATLLAVIYAVMQRRKKKEE